MSVARLFAKTLLIVFIYLANFGFTVAKAQFRLDEPSQRHQRMRGKEIDARVVDLFRELSQSDLRANAASRVEVIDALKELGEEGLAVRSPDASPSTR